ncbi:SH3 domain-containing protein [Peribacillus sp. SCS-155]|uniref:SH3 domain-containing protein n=1 Tax=Peribacillus sedimenti TaxID=3115297 RepID=UPI0039065128
MNKRSAFIMFVILISLLPFQSSETAFATTNSPKSNYIVYITGKKADIFNKPVGKKIATINQSYNESNDPIPTPNTLLVKKFVANHWVQVTHKTRGGKMIKGYVQTKYISANYISADYAVIDSVNGLYLRKSASSKSKVIITIPYGTRVNLIAVSGSKNEWYKVKYNVNNKSFIGFISNKYVR